MIQRMCVSITERGLQGNASNLAGQRLPAICFTTMADSRRCYTQALKVWHMDATLERSVCDVISVALHMMHGLQKKRFPGVQSITFDIGPGWIDCHVMLTTFDEVVLRYGVMGARLLVPVVQAGELERLPEVLLLIFSNAARSHFSRLALHLSLRARSRKTTDAA